MNIQANEPLLLTRSQNHQIKDLSFLKLIRLPNLLIVALTQCLIHFLIHIPVFRNHQLKTILSPSALLLLVLICVLVTAAGYIINDIYDYEIDLINKPNQVFINRHLSAIHAWIIYAVLNIGALILSVYLAYQIQLFGLVGIIIISILGLWVYSRSFKKLPLIGNIWVAAFCALVPGIMAFAERPNYISLKANEPAAFEQLLLLIGGYIIFAFCSTMVREIIKDLEDMEGDLKNNARTLPIAFGVVSAKLVTSFFAIALVVLLGYWIFHESVSTMLSDQLFLLLAVGLPIISLVFKLAFAKSKEHYHLLSQITKGIMIMGLLYIVVQFLNS